MTTSRNRTTPQPRSSAAHAARRSSTSTNPSVAPGTGGTSGRLVKVANLVVNVIWIVFAVAIVVIVISLLVMGEQALEFQIGSQEEVFPL